MTIDFPQTHIADKDRSDLLTWLLLRKRLFLYLSVGLIFISLAVSWSLSKPKKSLQPLIQVEKALTELGNALTVDPSTAKQWEDILQKNPELASKLENILAQHYLLQGDVVRAQQFAEHVLDRTAFLPLHYHADFTKASLLIAGQDYEAAIHAARGLKAAMLKEGVWQEDVYNGLLFGFNLLRIVFLSEKLGDIIGESEAIDEAKKYLGWNENAPEYPEFAERIGKKLLEHFSDRQVSILDYFTFRQSA